VRRAVIAGNTDRDRIARDAARDARAAGRGAGRAAGTWTVKDGPGGMQDIELLSQAGALIAGAREPWPARS
jgi:glutamate-ammonia-ligase adenylyltransferase